MIRWLLPILSLLTVLQLSGLPCFLSEGLEEAEACSSADASAGSQDDACPPLCPCCPLSAVSHALPSLGVAAWQSYIAVLEGVRPGFSPLEPDDVILASVFHPPRVS